MHHRRLTPRCFVSASEEQGGVDLVVPVGEDVRLYGELVTDDSFRVETPGIDFRRDCLDDDTVRR